MIIGKKLHLLARDVKYLFQEEALIFPGILPHPLDFTPYTYKSTTDVNL